MKNDACIFALTQVSNEFACECGELVTRRAGPDIACDSEIMHKKCSYVYEELKKVGLNAFEFEDDLTQVPHGIWAKIQFGGLLGLTAELDSDVPDKIDNIAQLIKLAEQKYQLLEHIPYMNYVPAMKNYRIRRRKK